jgi:hypothetical protein
MFFSLCQYANFCCILIFNYFIYCLVVCKEKEKAKEISRVSISDMQEFQCAIRHQLHSSSSYQFQSWVDILLEF